MGCSKRKKFRMRLIHNYFVCMYYMADRQSHNRKKFGGLNLVGSQYLARFSETVIKWKIYTDKDLFSNAVHGVDNNSRPLQAVLLLLVDQTVTDWVGNHQQIRLVFFIKDCLNINQYYGNMSCRVFKWGVQNQKDCCLRINILKENY